MGTFLVTTRQPAAAAAADLDAAGFDEIIRQHQRQVYRVIFLLVRDADAADTLTQECFLRAYLKRGSFRGESTLRTWLLRIAVNLARDHGRNRRASFWRRLVGLDSAARNEKLTRSPELVSPQPSPERLLLAREELGAVWEAVESLSVQQRAVFLLRFGEEMSLEEVGSLLGIKVGTVKAQLFRATGKLRQILKERERK
jgi:RNA polymerase sigma-70 factor, ECF subfamily